MGAKPDDLLIDFQSLAFSITYKLHEFNSCLDISSDSTASCLCRLSCFGSETQLRITVAKYIKSLLPQLGEVLILLFARMLYVLYYLSQFRRNLEEHFRHTLCTSLSYEIAVYEFIQVFSRRKVTRCSSQTLSTGIDHVSLKSIREALRHEKWPRRGSGRKR